jgi:hypothetical protein
MSAVRFAPNAFSNCRGACVPPSFRPGNGLRRRGHPQLLAAAIMAALFGDDQAVALQRQDAATERVKVLSY